MCAAVISTAQASRATKKIKARARLITSCANKINKSAENVPRRRLPSVRRQEDAFWN